MRKGFVAGLLALCLLLAGCDNWMNGSYISVTPHSDENNQPQQDVVSVSSYLELRTALADLVESGTESCVISIADMDRIQAESQMNMAVRYAKNQNPIGAYAVEDITYEFGTNAGQQAIAVNITYSHGKSELLRIKRYGTMEDALGAITTALEKCESDLILRIDNFENTDFTQYLQDYADAHPESVMEMPQVVINQYPETGDQRVLEVKYTYQTSRESLRNMQSRVQAVFSSAALYVSGDGEESEKFSQLFSFLMERYDYQIETSITPAYSLLRHGVGDSKAFATVYASMCRQAGLECLVVTGTRAGEPRFWNMICQDGVYCHVDLLRSSENGSFQCLTDAQMEGYVWDYSAYPACTGTTEPTE